VDPGTIRKLYIRAMATCLKAWDAAGGRIVPGSLSPANVAVPEPDFRGGSMVLSLAASRPCRRPSDLFVPLFAGFYRRVKAHHPILRSRLKVQWVFWAAVEALGPTRGRALLSEHLEAAIAGDRAGLDEGYFATLREFLATFDAGAFVPLSLANSVDRYRRWRAVTPRVTAAARQEEVEDLLRLYQLDRYGERARYWIYRHTYFEEVSEAARAAFDRLLAALGEDPARPATALVELSDLQSELTAAEDRRCFASLVFPHAPRGQEIEVVAHGEAGRELVIVRTRIVDGRGEGFEVREPVKADEVGRIYRLFFRERFPKTVSEQDRYLLTSDRSERIVAGIIYRAQEPAGVHLDGLVVHSGLRGRGLATALLEDFVARMSARGVRVVKTNYAMRAFCERRGFTLDPRRGGLVRHLDASGPRDALRTGPSGE
jgi:ribosomal protein S18 acetylase RimI-like enzyme